MIPDVELHGKPACGGQYAIYFCVRFHWSPVNSLPSISKLQVWHAKTDMLRHDTQLQAKHRYNTYVVKVSCTTKIMKFQVSVQSLSLKILNRFMISNLAVWRVKLGLRTYIGRVKIVNFEQVTQAPLWCECDNGVWTLKKYIRTLQVNLFFLSHVFHMPQGFVHYCIID